MRTPEVINKPSSRAGWVWGIQIVDVLGWTDLGVFWAGVGGWNILCGSLGFVCRIIATFVVEYLTSHDAYLHVSFPVW